MPIPDFDHNNVLPPHSGNPTMLLDLSPYECTTSELAMRFATSNARINILKKYLAFRAELQNRNFVNGFQWLDGSFLEDVETTQGRPPRDLDLITFYWDYDDTFLKLFYRDFPAFFDNSISKPLFLLDHYIVDVTFKQPEVIPDMIRYWVQLFSHNRSGVWKGMLKINLNTPDEDKKAFDHLNSL